jgi:hypothetical protein
MSEQIKERPAEGQTTVPAWEKDPLGGKRKIDPKTYEEASKPHETISEASSTMKTFFHVVELARIKFGISDLVCVATANFRDGDKIVPASSMLSLGDSSRAEEMLAYGLGLVDADRHARFEEIRGLARDQAIKAAGSSEGPAATGGDPTQAKAEAPA